jgi:DNA-binding CsgD family transcriptional regulator
MWKKRSKKRDLGRRERTGVASVAMVSARQLRDAVALARELDGVHDAPALQALLHAALPRIAGDLDESERALLELLYPAIGAAWHRAVAAQRAASAGLTPREVQVLDRVAAGDSNLLIARRLGVRPRTVDKHLEHAYAKLGVGSRTAAVACLRETAH